MFVLPKSVHGPCQSTINNSLIRAGISSQFLTSIFRLFFATFLLRFVFTCLLQLVPRLCLSPPPIVSALRACNPGPPN